MLAHESKSGPAFREALDELARLRRFAGPPAEFWPAFMAAAGGLAGACRGVLILRDPAQPDRLKKLSDWAANGHADRAVVTFTRSVAEIAQRCAEEHVVVRAIENGPTPETKHFAVALTIPLPVGTDTCIAAFLILNATEDQAREALARLQLAADTPSTYRLYQSVGQAKVDVEKFASVLDVMVLVNAEKRFYAAGLAFCNGLANRFNCDRVSLGWVEGGYIRLRTISRTERFDRTMVAAQALETAMEESFDQDEEVLWPAPEHSSLITKDHAQFAADHRCGHLCSLPLRLEDKPLAVLTCERQQKPFSETEVRQLRLACDQAIRRLSELKAQDRWFGARWTQTSKEQMAKLVGPEHTWAKVLSLLGVAAVVVLLLPIFTYRVEGNFVVRSDDVSYLTAPYDAYIREVPVRPGDPVKAGGVLLRLDTADLELEEASALAEVNRYLREVEKARADAESLRLNNKAPSLAEMKIAQALAEQARARLDLVRYRLSQSQIKAPFEGVLVEGDLRQRVGAPVKQGEALFKVARIDTQYVEAEIPERDVHEILNRTEGEVAFVAQPKLKYPVRVIRIEPAAVAKEGKNAFNVRAAFAGPIQPWWRPGMSGVCKLDVEKRTLLWILTHRTVDFLRLWLWW
jgi:RND family efflux transporter MFP subunit